MPPFASTLYAFLLLEGQQKKTTTKPPLDFAFKCNILQLAKKVDSINFNLSISYFSNLDFMLSTSWLVRLNGNVLPFCYAIGVNWYNCIVVDH